MKIRQLSYAGFTTLLLGGCNSYVQKTPPPKQAEADLTRAPTVAFVEVAAKLLESSCVRCHNSNRAAGGVKLDSYSEAMQLVVAGNSNASRLLQVIVSGAMPPNGARKPDADALALLAKWIDEGAVETLPDRPDVRPPVVPPPPPPPEDTPPVVAQPAVTFALLHEQVLKPRCADCHEGEFAAGDIDLSSYAGILNSNKDGKLFTSGNPDEGLLYNSVTDDFMPMSMDENDPIPLTPEQKALLMQWIIDGAKP